MVGGEGRGRGGEKRLHVSHRPSALLVCVSGWACGRVGVHSWAWVRVSVCGGGQCVLGVGFGPVAEPKSVNIKLIM